MSWKQMFFVLFLLAVCPSFGQTFPVTFSEEWAPQEEFTLRQVVDAIQSIAPYLNSGALSTAPRKIVKGPVGGNWADGGTVILGARPQVDASKNAYVNTVLAHELGGHLYMAFQGPGGGWFDLSPNLAVREGLPELFAWVAPELLRPVLPRAPRSRSVQRGPSPLPFQKIPADLGLKSQTRQEDMLPCENGYTCPDYFGQTAYVWWQFFRAACGGAEVADCGWVIERIHQVYNRLVEQEWTKGEPYRKVRLEDFLDGLDRAFPGVLVSGMRPSVFFGTRSVFGQYREGEGFSVQVFGGWRDVSGTIRQAPANPTTWEFKAWYFPSRLFVGEGWQEPLPLRSGRFVVQMRSAKGEPVCLDSTTCDVVVDLSKVDGGIAMWPIAAQPRQPGLYSITALRLLPGGQLGETVARSFAMVTPAELRLEAEKDGIFIWNVREDGQIENSPILPPNDWQVLFAGGGLTQAIPPKGARSVALAGQEFTLTGEVEALRLNGSRSRPVLRADPAEVRLSPARMTATVRVDQINPNCRSWELRAYPRPISVQQPWFDTEVAENSITIRARQNLTLPREGRVCFQTTEGVSAPCVEVFYAPR